MMAPSYPKQNLNHTLLSKHKPATTFGEYLQAKHDGKDIAALTLARS